MVVYICFFKGGAEDMIPKMGIALSLTFTTILLIIIGTKKVII